MKSSTAGQGRESMTLFGMNQKMRIRENIDFKPIALKQVVTVVKAAAQLSHELRNLNSAITTHGMIGGTVAQRLAHNALLVILADLEPVQVGIDALADAMKGGAK